MTDKETCPFHGAKEQTCNRAYDKMEKNIGHVPVFFKELAGTNKEMHNAILELDNYIWSDGELSRQEKKLIAISIAAALRDDHALAAQIMGAKNLGITLKQIDEALRVTFMLSGMPAYVAGKTAAEKIYRP